MWFVGFVGFVWAKDCGRTNWLLRALRPLRLNMRFVRFVGLVWAKDCGRTNRFFRPLRLHMWFMRLVGLVWFVLCLCGWQANKRCQSCRGQEATEPPKPRMFCFHLSLPSR